MPFDSEFLKERLISEKNLGALWNMFMDATEDPEFLRGGRTSDAGLFAQIKKYSEVVIARIPGVRLQALDLFEATPGELYHGPLVVNTGMGNVFYFKSINAGLFAIPSGGKHGPKTMFVRFSIDWNLEGASQTIH